MRFLLALIVRDTESREIVATATRLFYAVRSVGLGIFLEISRLPRNSRVTAAPSGMKEPTACAAMLSRM